MQPGGTAAAGGGTASTLAASGTPTRSTVSPPATFSGTIVGDSYLIKDGKLAGPVKPNTLRMNDDILQVINNILGIGAERVGTVRWSSDQVTWAPEIAVTDFHLEEIGGYMDEVF